MILSEDLIKDGKGFKMRGAKIMHQTMDRTEAEKLHRHYAILSENETMEFPEHVREEHFETPFIDHLGQTRKAKGILYLPESEAPCPWCISATIK